MKTAFETLKKYCEDYLAPEEYRVVGGTSSYLPTIYFITDGFITYQCFEQEGYFLSAGYLDDDNEMIEHIEQEKAKTPWTISDNR